MKKTLARKYEHSLAIGSIDIEQIKKLAIQKDNDYRNERTWWIFEDGSAIGECWTKTIYVRTNYGLDKDNEQL